MATPVTFHVAALLCLALVGSSLVDAVPSRNRRSLWELDTLVECYTGRSALMMINGYGCWCGLGGSGKPVDETDGCCQQHDFCYGILQENNCGVYFSSYGYTKHGCDTGRGYVTCTAEVDTCERALCECDRNLATCLRQHSDTYNEAFANFEKSFCDVDASLNNDIPTSSNSTSMLTVVTGRDRDAYQVDTANDLGTGPIVSTDNAPERGVLRQLDMRRSDGVNNNQNRGVLAQLDTPINADGAVAQN